ncbi:transcriptional regulator [Pseudomonas protegens]|uniref:Transcriptional regulator n=1 Tax=Pseudomonas protegens TaxID=380021 RepID=A0A2T6GBI1_9PSED|nr:transcription termination/antitermination NusG family protein [Pseudomonas protegens]PUA41514.1 transcriptional regulator [Pseudomonas protegens]
MTGWYLITHKLNAFQWVTSKSAELGVEVFSPTLVELRKRPDRPSCRKFEKQLFPGYLFLRFDPYEIHTTLITAIAGVQGFVGFGGLHSQVRDEVIEKMRRVLQPKLRSDRTLSRIEYRELPDDLTRALRLIIEMPSELCRKAALFELLKNDAYWTQLAASSQDLSRLRREATRHLFRLAS